MVKIADNAHNSLLEREQALAEKWPDKPPVTKYRDARPVLYAAVEVEEIRKMVTRVNPWLLEELDDRLDEEDTTDYENLSYEEPDADVEAALDARTAGSGSLCLQLPEGAGPAGWTRGAHRSRSERQAPARSPSGMPGQTGRRLIRRCEGSVAVVPGLTCCSKAKGPASLCSQGKQGLSYQR
ncbi:hypothetical protein RCH21_002810 [Arthrobacter sp. PL16]|nr:hypothetical protein [Arthrobacter sp. PL16]